MAISDSIRARYPHEAPSREAYASDGEYSEALMRYFKGQAELTEGFFSAIPFAAVTTLGDGHIAYANSQAQQLFGLTPADWPRNRANDFLFDADGNPIGVQIGKRVTEGESIRQEVVYVRRPDGRREMRLLSVAPVFMPPTRYLARAIGLFQDPGPLERELETLRVMNHTLTDSHEAKTREAEHYRILAYTDDLTGLPNKRAYGERGREMVEDQRRKAGSILAVMIDPDNFKPKNDRYGHDYGDELIREIGGKLRGPIEAVDGIAARFGGDEFFCIIPGLDQEGSESLLKILVPALNFPCEATVIRTGEIEEFQLGMAIGATLRMNGVIPDLGQLLREADKAMYESKESGKGEAKTKPYVLRLPRILSSKPPL